MLKPADHNRASPPLKPTSAQPASRFSIPTRNTQCRCIDIGTVRLGTRARRLYRRRIIRVGIRGFALKVGTASEVILLPPPVIALHEAIDTTIWCFLAASPGGTRMRLSSMLLVSDLGRLPAWSTISCLWRQTG